MTAKRLVLVGAFVVVFAAGAYAAVRFFGAAEDDAASLVPKDALMYGHVFLDPSTQQKLALRDLLEKFPDYDTPGKARGALADLIDDALEGTGVTYAEDVEPWLGDEVAGFLAGDLTDESDAESAVLIATSDGDAALETLHAALDHDDDPVKEEYKGIEYSSYDNGDSLAVVEDFAVVGTEPGVRAVIDTPSGDSLEDSERFREATGGLRDDRVALAYMDPNEFMQTARASGDLTAQDEQAIAVMEDQFRDPIAAVVFAESDFVALEQSSTLVDDAHDPDPNVINHLPGDAWIAMGVNDFGSGLGTLFENMAVAGDGGDLSRAIGRQVRRATGLDLRRGLLSWIGDTSLFVMGAPPNAIGGGVVIDSTDLDRSRRAVTRIARFLVRERIPVSRLRGFGDEAFAVHGFAPFPINVVGTGPVIVAVGDRATREAFTPSSTLEDQAGFIRAQHEVGSAYALSLFVDVPAIMQFSGDTPTFVDPAGEKVRASLDSIAYVAAGSRRIGDRRLDRVVVGVGDADSIRVGMR